MAKTVIAAFSQFLNDTINIQINVSDTAKSSREFLKQQIQNLSHKNQFFKLASQYDTNFGSFARKTKIRELDDIDIIICLNGSLIIEGNQWDNIKLRIQDNCTDKFLIKASNPSNILGTKLYLNSNKVKNRIVSALQNVAHYDRADIHARGEAITLKLKSYSWTFDIVPGFYCSSYGNTKSYYLIPNGNGQWKKTNPKIEQTRVSKLNQKFNNIVLSTIRLVKYCNRRGKMPNITSYVLETMVLDYFDQTNHTSIDENGQSHDFPDIHFKNALNYISNNIMSPVRDSKGFEFNINTLDYNQKNKLQIRAKTDYDKAIKAIDAELDEKDHKKSMNIWRDIFGDKFPYYG